MRNKWLAGLMIVMLALGFIAFDSMNLAATTVEAEEAEQFNRVTVNGEGRLLVKPDVAYVNVGIEAQNADADEAQKEARDKMNRIMRALEQLGIDEENIETLGYSLNRQYNYYENSREEYYMARNTVKVTVDDLDRVGAIIDGVTAAGANNINSVRFAIKDESQYYNEALKLAMENAKGKATAIMSTFGKTPGAPLTVNESSYGGPIYREAPMMMDAMAAEEAASTPIQSGDLEVKANVSVSYGY